MRIDKVHIKTRFKNLEDFEIDFDESSMKTVLIGLNATGKSNFLESLLIIFGSLELEDHSDLTFNYSIKYNCWNKDIEIDYDLVLGYTFNIKEVVEDKLVEISIENKKRKLFFNKRSEYLPKHLFVYYSGISNRLEKYYNKHVRKYYESLIDEKKFEKYSKFNEIPPVFLVQKIHGSIALISFFLFSNDDKYVIDFLKNEIKINDLSSFLFVIKQPNWANENVENDLFWGAKGLVKRFLEQLWLFSLSPIYHKKRTEKSYSKNETLNLLYLFIKDKKTFNDLIEIKYESNQHLFNALNSIHLSDMLLDLKVNVEKVGVNGELSMSELSEGEQQLLTVLGLLRFTKDEESLILLDEPDTHLNPQWKWKYIDFLDKVVGNPKTTQIILCTHDPLVIGGLDKKEVVIFKKVNDKTISFHPSISPKEMSVDKILTSEMFGIKSIMSKELEDKLNAKRYLQTKILNGTITENEKEDFVVLEAYLESVSFYDTFVDSRFEQFVNITSELEGYEKRTYSDEEKLNLNEIAKQVLKSILNSDTK